MVLRLHLQTSLHMNLCTYLLYVHMHACTYICMYTCACRCVYPVAAGFAWITNKKNLHAIFVKAQVHQKIFFAGYTYMYVCICMPEYTHFYIHIYIGIHSRDMCRCMYICKPMYVYMNVCIYICLYIHTM